MDEALKGEIIDKASYSFYSLLTDRQVQKRNIRDSIKKERHRLERFVKFYLIKYGSINEITEEEFYSICQECVDYLIQVILN